MSQKKFNPVFLSETKKSNEKFNIEKFNKLRLKKKLNMSLIKMFKWNLLRLPRKSLKKFLLPQKKRQNKT